jgi:hypothetical protein
VVWAVTKPGRPMAAGQTTTARLRPVAASRGDNQPPWMRGWRR